MRVAFNAVISKIIGVLFALFAALAFVAVAPDSAKAVEAETIAGQDRYETASLQAVRAFPGGAKVAILTSGDAWADALSAAGLAGAIDCPILFTRIDALPESTKSAMEQLGTEHVVIVGGEGRVSAAVVDELQTNGIAKVDRAAGQDRFETQLAVYEYGRLGYDGTNHWGDELVVVATGVNFPDALSAASVAFSQKAPVFLVDGFGVLSDKQEEAIVEIQPKRAIILGGVACVSDETYNHMRAITASFSDSGTPDATRLAGEDRYETSAKIAEWCVSEGYLGWDGAAFTVGTLPYDALAGSTLQGKKASVMLLLNEIPAATIDSLVGGYADVSSLVYFGSTALISASVRTYIEASVEEGKLLPMGGTTLSNGDFVWVDSSGAEFKDAEYFEMWFERANSYTSATDWLLIVDTVLNETVIFRMTGDGWVIDKHWPCSTGAAVSPTVKGEFTIKYRGLSFGHGYTCWYWTQFYGDYLFHSVTYNPGSMTSIQEGKLGVNISLGCVRLDIDNAKWIYDNIPYGSKVVIL